ncbi:MAG: hypothetical protein WC267_03410 [Bacilli bacterium]
MLKVIKEVLTKIENKGFQAYVVGGFVRDYYLGQISNDIDICTRAKITDLKDIFPQIVSINKEYGSVVIEYKKLKIQITTFRKDIAYHRQLKQIKVEYVLTLAEDLKRRDFTINTLCLDKDLNIVDMFNAREDLNHKIVRTLGNPDTRLKEDPLRILRAIRLATVLNFSLDSKLKQAIKDNKELLSSLSFYRQKNELDKIFASAHVKYGLNLLQEFKLDKELKLNLKPVVVTSNYLGIWAQLDCNQYEFTSEEAKTIMIINKLIRLDLTDPYVLYKHDLKWLKIASEIRNMAWSKVLTQYQSLPIKSSKEIKISFTDIEDILKVNDKRQIKQIYNDIEQKILYNKLNNNYLTLKNYILKKK